MKFRILTTICLGLLLATSSAFAVSPGNDLLIAGAARTSRWTADLYINNPGTTSVSVDVMWLERDQANPSPVTATFPGVAPGETLILDDVLRNTFGMSRATGAFRITATGGEVTANLVVFTGAGSESGTYGSGFEAIPAASATSAGETTTLAGIASDGDFYTNLFALAGASGVTMNLDLLDPDGNVLDSQQVVLESYEPWLSSVASLWDVASFENGTAQARISAGSMVLLGSKIDILSNDPTTLEQAFGAGGGTVDGTYRFAIWDSMSFATGGNLEVDGGVVVAITGTYINYDKTDGQDEPECTLLFQFGAGFAPTAVVDFETGVEFIDSYPDGSDLTWTITFMVDDNLGFTGTIEAVGENFTGIDEGCNGSFPYLDFEGGKAE